MKIVCYKDKIIKALNSVVKGVASKTTIDIDDLTRTKWQVGFTDLHPILPGGPASKFGI